MVGTMQSRSYGATYGAYGASNADVTGWVVYKNGVMMGAYGNDEASAREMASDMAGQAVYQKPKANVGAAITQGLSFLTQGVQAVTQIVGQKPPQQAAPVYVAPKPKAAQSNTMLYVAGGVVVVAVLGAGVYFATRKRGR